MALLKSTGSKKVNLDFNKEFINTFSNNIENKNIDLGIDYRSVKCLKIL